MPKWLGMRQYSNQKSKIMFFEKQQRQNWREIKFIGDNTKAATILTQLADRKNVFVFEGHYTNLMSLYSSLKKNLEKKLLHKIGQKNVRNLLVVFSFTETSLLKRKRIWGPNISQKEKL